MSLENLQSKTKRKAKKRVGRGNASGHGTYSCRGMKGQSARAGGRRRPGFEGGQTPYLQRMPKLKGFKNPGRVEYQVINVGELNVFDEGANVTLEDLLAKNLVSKKSQPVKLLAGKGNLEKKLTISVNKASAQAVEKVKAQKGEVKILEAKKETKNEKKEEGKETKEN